MRGRAVTQTYRSGGRIGAPAAAQRLPAVPGTLGALFCRDSRMRSRNRNESAAKVTAASVAPVSVPAHRPRGGKGNHGTPSVPV
ncbi:hypothetical protein TPA0906_13590 [Streptomyces olivaceus]|nr:hypothetical protein TPA0906_13590 [Streptomyces olivaceus]